MKESDRGSERLELTGGGEGGKKKKKSGRFFFPLLTRRSGDSLILRQRQIFSERPTILPASHHLTKIGI